MADSSSDSDVEPDRSGSGCLGPCCVLLICVLFWVLFILVMIPAFHVPEGYVAALYPPREHAPSLGEAFGVTSISQVAADVWTVLKAQLWRQRFQFGLSSLGLLRPDLSFPAYLGLVPDDGLAPIYNLFDRCFL